MVTHPKHLPYRRRFTSERDEPRCVLHGTVLDSSVETLYKFKRVIKLMFIHEIGILNLGPNET